MRWIVGALLIGAAVLKGAQINADAAAALVGGRGVLVQFALEWIVGWWALLGLGWKRLRWLATVLFTGFASYSFILALRGADSCGCFGPVKVNPWWALALDVGLVVGLLGSIASDRAGRAPAHKGAAEEWQPGWRLGALAAVSLAGVAAALGMAGAAPATSTAGLTTVGDLTVLEPEKWVGRPLPIAEWIDLDLMHGRWVVLLHRHDCTECQKALPSYEQRAASEPVAFIEVPPFGPPACPAAGAISRLDDARAWFVQTPVEIRLEDGIVVAASYLGEHEGLD